MDLYLVTGNEDKAREVQEILGFPIKAMKLDLPEIQSLDIEEVVRQKVQAAFERVQKPVIVDDVGFYIKAWNGFPGPFIKFILSAGGNELLLRMMEREDDRTVIAKTAIGFHSESTIYTFVGEAKGQLVREPRGNSWGWEPIFQPEEKEETYAEMDRIEKNSISMRRRALEKFKAFLDSQQT